MAKQVMSYRTFFIIAGLCALGAIISPNHRSSRGGIREQAENAIVKAQLAMKNMVKDPSSVKWSKVTYAIHSGAVCGHMNAKNSFGGYTGMTEFIYFAGSGKARQNLSKVEDNKFVETWNTICLTPKAK